MPTIERCVHQGVDSGVHVLFKEQWERCKHCAYDPENNKRCPNYSPTGYSVQENIYENKLIVVHSIAHSNLGKAIA